MHMGLFLLIGLHMNLYLRFFFIYDFGLCIRDFSFGFKFDLIMGLVFKFHALLCFGNELFVSILDVLCEVAFC